MTTLRHTLLALAMVGASVGAFAQTDAEHAQHHPSDTPQKATKAPVAKPKPVAKESMAAMDSTMNRMREMHEKMMAAKTPEERKALMADHMKAMQEGMRMMGSMAPMGDAKGMGGMASGASTKGMSMDMMEKRMEMMTSMMQMMMDRLPEEPAR